MTQGARVQINASRYFLFLNRIPAKSFRPLLYIVQKNRSEVAMCLINLKFVREDCFSPFLTLPLSMQNMGKVM